MSSLANTYYLSVVHAVPNQMMNISRDSYTKRHDQTPCGSAHFIHNVPSSPRGFKQANVVYLWKTQLRHKISCWRLYYPLDIYVTTMRKKTIGNFWQVVKWVGSHLAYSFLFNLWLKLRQRGLSKSSVWFSAIVIIGNFVATVSFNQRCQVLTKSMTLQAVNHRIDSRV